MGAKEGGDDLDDGAGGAAGGTVVARGVAVQIEAARDGDAREQLDSADARPFDAVWVYTTQGVPAVPLRRRDVLLDEANMDPETGLAAKYRVVGRWRRSRATIRRRCASGWWGGEEPLPPPSPAGGGSLLGGAGEDRWRARDLSPPAPPAPRGRSQIRGGRDR